MIDRLKALAPLLLLLVLLPILVLSIRFRQLLFPRATHTSIPSRVLISPGQIQTSSPSNPPIYLSAQAVDTSGSDLRTGVTYVWGISSTNSVGDLIVQDNTAIATFIAKNTGHGDIWVKAITPSGQATSSIPVCIGTPCPISPPTVNPINWQAPSVSLTADDVHIELSGHRFYGQPDANTGVSLGPAPTATTDPLSLSAQAQWTENGFPITLRLFFYRNSTHWWISGYSYSSPGLGEAAIGPITLYPTPLGSPITFSGDYSPSGYFNFHVSNLLLRAYTTPISPTPTTNHPIWWETSSAILRADDFYIDTNGQRFFGTPDPGTTLRLGSDPPNGTDPDSTTLEATWTEHGVEMRLNIYFERTGGAWRAYEIRTYNGQTPGDWVYYNFAGAGSAIGTPTTTIGDWDFVNTPQSRYSGQLHLNTIYLQAFLTNSLSFKTALQGISGRRGPDQVVNMALTPVVDSPTSVAHDVTVVSDGAGTYFGSFGSNLTPGTYDILIKGPAHLRKRFTNYYLAPGDNFVDLSSVPLLAGDFDNNNDINILDIGEILGQYTALSVPATPVNTLYDVNKDGTIDITDIGLVLSNYTALSNPGD